MRIVRCCFPFPAQNPPVEMPEGCSAKCANYDAQAFARHGRIKQDDPELLETVRSFTKWFYAEGQEQLVIDEQIRFAAELYIREDHAGTCIPKVVLFMHFKFLQYNQYGPDLELSENAKRALKGEQVPSWPDGELAQGPTWNQMFHGYSTRYE